MHLMKLESDDQGDWTSTEYGCGLKNSSMYDIILEFGKSSGD